MDILREIRNYALICPERVAVRRCGLEREIVSCENNYPGADCCGSGHRAMNETDGEMEPGGEMDSDLKPDTGEKMDTGGSGDESILTYRDLWAYSGALADWLVRHIGVNNAPIPVYGHKHPWMLVCFLACVRAGHAYCPIDVSVPDERVRAILESLPAGPVFAVEPLRAETGVKPMLVLLPVNGYYYDWTGFPASARQAYYEKVKGVAEEFGAEIADFTDQEYTKYFFEDRVHIGKKGWVLVNEKLWEFYEEA